MFTSLKKLWVLLKPFHGTFYMFLGFLVAYESMKLAESYFQSVVISLFQRGATLQFWLLFFAGLIVFDEIFLRFDGFLDLRIIDTNNLIYRFLRVESLKKLFRLDMAWHRNSHSGAMAEKINKGTDKINELVREGSWDMLPTLMQVLVSLIPIFWLSPWVGILLLGMLILFLNESRKAYNFNKPQRKARHDLYEQEGGNTVEWIQGITTVRYSGAQNQFEEVFRGIHEDILRVAHVESRSMIEIYSRRRVRILSFARRAIWGVFAFQLVSGALTIASFVFILTLTEKVLNSFWRLSRLFDNIGESIEGINRLTELLDTQSNLLFNGKVIQLPQDSTVGFNSVGFKYPQGKAGVQAIDLQAKPGTITALVGASGAGKTTLMQLLMRMYDVDSGSITIGEVDIRDLTEEALFQAFALVPQSPEIFNGSILYNITLGVDIAEKKVIESCRKAAFWETVEGLDNGLGTVVGERGVKLSGGQRQRLALARALVRDNAKIMILDEPTSAQDAETESQIQEHVFQSFQGPVFVIAHRLSTIKHADQILVMRDGKIVERGTHNELVTANGFYAELISKQL
jgi:ABC-type multidrug transport system fused ATPase/permease subunit